MSLHSAQGPGRTGTRKRYIRLNSVFVPALRSWSVHESPLVSRQYNFAEAGPSTFSRAGCSDRAHRMFQQGPNLVR